MIQKWLCGWLHPHQWSVVSQRPSYSFPRIELIADDGYEVVIGGRTHFGTKWLRCMNCGKEDFQEWTPQPIPMKVKP